MKKASRLIRTIVLISLFYPAAIFSQSPVVQKLVDTSLQIMQANAVNASEIDWPLLRNEVSNQIKGITHPYQLGNTFRYILKRLNDFHGSVFYADSTFKWNRDEPVVSDSIKNEWTKKIYLLPQVIEKDIGYIRIPSMSFSSREDVDAKAQNLNDSLCYLLNRGVKGLIIDLRLNAGGAMHPMILGVAQLLKSGKIGSFSGRQNIDWIIANNAFISGKDTIVSIRPRCDIDATKIPVIILSGPNTGSSAEFFIIAFKSRKNTALLGTTTAGYITSIGGFPIDEYGYIYLSTGYGVDRNGKIYQSAITPDIALESVDKFNDLKNDEKVKAAIEWLLKHTLKE